MEHNSSQFNSDSDEEFRIENDILKLKLHAQYGEAFQIHTCGDLPPEVENQFLKNVIAFEEANEDKDLVKVHDLLGNPVCKPEKVLSMTEIDVELQSLMELMLKKKMVLDVCTDYDNRVIYKFITEELFEHKTMFGFQGFPDMVTHFTYEEFHPNHKYDIENRVLEFMYDWFEQKFNEFSWEIADPLLLADGRVLEKKIFLEKLKIIFDSYVSFIDHDFAIADIKFQLDEKEDGLGYAEGAVEYNAVLESGEVQYFKGPFKFYLSRQHNWWSIFYFIFPGFEW